MASCIVFHQELPLELEGFPPVASCVVFHEELSLELEGFPPVASCIVFQHQELSIQFSFGCPSKRVAWSLVSTRIGSTNYSLFFPQNLSPLLKSRKREIDKTFSTFGSMALTVGH